MGLLKKLAGETFLYGLSSIIGRVLNYLLVPLYTAVFTGAEYGVVTELYAYVAFLNVIYLYGLETAYFRFSNKEGIDEQHIFNSGVTSIIISSTILSGSLYIFSEPIAELLGYASQAFVIKWLALILALDAVAAIPFARLRLQGKARVFVFAKLVNIGTNILLNLLFILWIPSTFDQQSMLFGHAVANFYAFDWGVEYIFLANLLANSLLLILLHKAFRGFTFHFDFNQLKPMLTYSWPILITGLAGVTNEMLSRVLLKYWLPPGYYGEQSNLSALGVFGACYKLSVFMTLAVQAFRYAAEPFFFSKAENKNSPELFAAVTHWFVLFGALAYLVISLNLDLLGFIFLRSPEFRVGLSVVPYLLLGGLFLGVYYNLSIWYKLTDQTKYGAYISIFGALITIVGNYLLIPIYGYLGSALVTTLTYLSMVLMSYQLGKKFFPVPYKKGNAAFLLVLAVVMVETMQLIALPTLGHVALRIVATILFMVVAYFTNRRFLRDSLRKFS